MQRKLNFENIEKNDTVRKFVEILGLDQKEEKLIFKHTVIN